MKRALAAVALFTAAVSFASPTLAESPEERASDRIERKQEARPRYKSTLERWRGRPHLRSAPAHPASEATGSEKVYQHLPSVNFLLEGQYGAFSAR